MTMAEPASSQWSCTYSVYSFIIIYHLLSIVSLKQTLEQRRAEVNAVTRHAVMGDRSLPTTSANVNSGMKPSKQVSSFFQGLNANRRGTEAEEEEVEEEEEEKGEGRDGDGGRGDE